MAEFLSKKSVRENCQCSKNLIGIAAYHKNERNTNSIAISYSETLKGRSCDGEHCNCEYVDIFGIMLIKLATKLTDISMCNLYITSIDSETGEYKDPLKDNKSAVRLLLHTGVTVIRVKTDDGDIKYNRQALMDLLVD